MALVQIKKAYPGPGHALRVMMGVWSHLRHFMYYPRQQEGLDATNKWPGETQREWGRTVTMDAQVQARMNGIFDTLGVCIEVKLACGPRGICASSYQINSAWLVFQSGARPLFSQKFCADQTTLAIDAQT